MTTPTILVPEAKADIADAYFWYEDQSQGLGVDFLGCVEDVLLSITRTPLIYPLVHETYRRALLRRFPYAIFFEVDERRSISLVYSVFHCAQKPDKWRARLPRFRKHV